MPAAPRYAPNGEFLIHRWGDEVVVYHLPSATTLAVSPLMAEVLQRLREGPRDLQELRAALAGRDEAEDSLEAHLREGLRQLYAARIITRPGP